MNLKNNLFNYVTSELSQDAFLCWLASYALEDAEPDDTLRSCAREMLELFVPEFNGPRSRSRMWNGRSGTSMPCWQAICQGGFFFP